MKRKVNRSNIVAAAGFLAPNFLGFAIFTAGPVLFSLVVSLSNWNLQRTVPFAWVGIRNYTDLIHAPEFWLYLVNTGYLMLGIPLAIIGSLILAILLSGKIKGLTVYRTLFYLPSFTSGVALMILWKALYNPDFGPINAAINWLSSALHLGVGAPQWLLSTANLLGLDVERVAITARQWGLGARDAIIIMGIWTAIGGNNMLLYIAALTNVSEELIEAAQLDGAGKWQIFRSVTWPSLAPTTFFIVVMSLHRRPSRRIRASSSDDGWRPRRDHYDHELPHLHQGLRGVSDRLCVRDQLGAFCIHFWCHAHQLEIRQQGDELLMGRRAENRKQRAGFAGTWRGAGSYIILPLIALTTLAPFLWMVLSSFKSVPEMENLNPIPTVWRPGNYLEVFRQIPFARYYFNSVFIAAWVTFLTCLTSSMAAFAFARLRWPGRDLVFKLYLATMMIPGVVVMIPNYTLMVKMHMIDSYVGLIVPAAFSAFGTFLLRQFMLTIPPALDEAAQIDGASAWRTFWDVVLPLARPGIITLAIFTFMGNYGSFLWPLILIKSESLRTLPIGMLFFSSDYGRQTNLIMAASVMNILPLVILFVISQKYLVKGIQLGAVKG